MIYTFVIIIGFVFSFYCVYEWGLNLENVFLGFLMSLAISFLLCLITALFGLVFKNEPVYAETQEIYAINDNYVIRHRSSESMKYCYMILSDDGYCYKEAPAVKSSFIYTNDTPHVDVYQYQYANSIVRWLWSAPIKEDKYIFFIPEGSITNNYIIDME